MIAALPFSFSEARRRGISDTAPAMAVRIASKRWGAVSRSAEDIGSQAFKKTQDIGRRKYVRNRGRNFLMSPGLNCGCDLRSCPVTLSDIAIADLERYAVLLRNSWTQETVLWFVK